MGQVLEFKRRVFSGAEIDMAVVPNPAVGDRYNTTDTNRSFFYSGASWVYGLLESMIDHTWEGDDVNNREVFLGFDFDLILIFLEEAKAGTDDHLCLAYAFKTCYGVFLNVGSSTDTEHRSMASANAEFQGKMTGGDVAKIKLGSGGAGAGGTNKAGWTYRLIGFKFQDML